MRQVPTKISCREKTLVMRHIERYLEGQVNTVLRKQAVRSEAGKPIVT